MKRIALLTALAFATPAMAQSPQQPYAQFNPFSGRFEMAYPNSQPTFNPYNGSWSMQPEGVQPQFNPYDGKFEFPH